MGTLPASTEPDLSRDDGAIRLLDSRVDYERFRSVPYEFWQWRLEAMRRLLAQLGHPEATVPVVHVAGTKGKGSTATMIGAVLTAAGYRTGVFTSPHLVRVEERIAIDGRACTAGELAELTRSVAPAVLAMDRQAATAEPPTIGPSYFEVATAMALVHFARCKVDLAVLEVGLGGRFDATNVCLPQVSVITSISFDHTAELGNTLESIAREKAGIIRPGVPVVSGVTEPAARNVIREVCRRQGSPLCELGVQFGFDYQPPRHLESAPAAGRLDFRWRQEGRGPAYQNLLLGLAGRHQAANAAVALAALAELGRSGWPVPEAAVRQGLASAVCPARVELVARQPTVIIDGAHNVASVQALLEVLDESFSAGRRLLVFAASQDKDVRGMLRLLLGRFDQAVFTRYLSNPRAVAPEALGAIAAELTGRSYPLRATPAAAWEAVWRQATAGDLICVTGSLYLAGELRAALCSRQLPLAGPMLVPQSA